MEAFNRLDPEPASLNEEHEDTPASSGISKRLLTGSAITAALLSRTRAQSQKTAGTDRDYIAERKLLRRVTMGVNEAERQSMNALGYSRYMHYQLDHTAIDDRALDTYLQQTFPTLFMTPTELFHLPFPIAQDELEKATLCRAVRSKRQLFERMAEFWSDHFNIAMDKVLGLKTVDDREVIRRHALGKFPDMLRASAYSPAMLKYLDNSVNFAVSPNQNYAREIMELHTLSVNGGYTQQDVIEVTRCFTGWTYITNGTHPQGGEFIFNPGVHDKKEKVVLGHTIPANRGLEDGEQVLDILANHPSTAHFIATKMCRWLLSYDPPTWLVAATAKTYMRTGGDIREMIKTILQPKIVHDAPSKFKRPFHLLTSILRATGANVTQWNGAWQSLYGLGHQSFEWKPPNGYPDTLEFWSGLVLSRWNIAFSLLNNEIPGVTVNVNTLQSSRTATGVTDRINMLLFDGEMLPQDRADLLAFLQPDPPSEAQVREALALALTLPSFQWY